MSGTLKTYGEGTWGILTAKEISAAIEPCCLVKTSIRHFFQGSRPPMKLVNVTAVS